MLGLKLIKVSKRVACYIHHDTLHWFSFNLSMPSINSCHVEYILGKTMWYLHFLSILNTQMMQGAVLIYRCSLITIGIPIIKIRRFHNHLIFILEIPIPGKTISILRHRPRSWIPSMWKTMINFSYTLNTVVSDDLAMQGASASAAMVLTNVAETVLVSALEEITNFM